jgi:Tol biopolymer transport system component
VAGGPTELVLETRQAAAVHCTTGPDGSCLLFEYDSEERAFTFSRLDPVAGRGEELFHSRGFPTDLTKLALSPDGSRSAMAFGTIVGILDLTTGEVTQLSVQVDGLSGIDFLSGQTWSPDGTGFYVTGGGRWGGALLRVDLQGQAKLLHEVPEGVFLYSPKLSPNGRHLAFEQTTRESNVWIVEEF